MSKIIEFGAFLSGVPTWARQQEAARVGSDLGVTVQADGSNFGPTDAVKVTVVVPDTVVLTPEVVADGRDRFDALLEGTERLTDYALVKQDGVLTQVVSLITGESRAVQQRGAQAPAPTPAPATPAAPRRWSLRSALRRS